MLQIGYFGRAYHHPIPSGWPNRPALLGPGDARSAYEQSLEDYLWADEAGFDFVSVSEHHYSTFIDPNPVMTAAALSRQLANARICLLGATVPLLNPVRVAEELAMLDVMTNGRLTVGLLRGTPNEALTYYNINPTESRGKFQEAVELIRSCWTEPEPFAWEGRYYRFRTVAAWPQPMTPGGPRLLMSGSNAQSVELVARNHADLGLSYIDLADTTRCIQMYHEAVARHGWQADRTNVLYRNFCYVAETDEQAYAEAEQCGYGSLKRLFAPNSLLGMHAILESVTGSYRDMPTSQARQLQQEHVPPAFCGSPATVIEQLRQFYDAGVGHIDLTLTGLGLSHDVSRRNMELFATEVLPAVRRFSDDVVSV
jgi:alkanesulfonate monooxygenase SsuD/methylene tetrahydromethanopterin reductase-like flavin-dependent oxidoreductase (luciferase family)